MSFESSRADPQERLLDNPVAIRAIAHPVRLALIGLVSREGPTTSAQAARELGISQALASHHLRQLAKYGFLEPAAQHNGRDRPWQGTAVTTSWRGTGTDPQRAAAADVLERLIAEQAVAKLLDWQQRSSREDARWRDVTGVSSHLMYLTLDELAELTDAIDALVTPLVRRRQAGEPRPADAVPVDLTTLVSVLPPTSSGN